ncbi:MAG: alpha/beta hydrolase [Actinobacteria bacterium]|nr:alpha/beta hydrolase [Actinomycetota bacterium]
MPKRRARVSGGDLAYVDEGEGPAVVLLHAYPLSSSSWRQFVPMFAGRFRVIAPDLLGAGGSAKPADEPLDVGSQAARVAELLDGLAVGGFAAVGEGHGGGVAQLLALAGARVEAMVLLTSVCFGLEPLGLSAGARPAAAPTTPLVHEAIRRVLRTGMRRHERLTEDLVAEHARPFLDDPAAGFRLMGAIDGSAPAGPEPEGFDFPVLVMWGEDDACLPPAAAERLNDAIATSSLGLLPGCGHFLTEEAPETLAPMVAEYLRARYLKAPHGHEGVVTIPLGRRPPWEGDDG